jgi:predicted DNA-binding transcriptional regulator YafY
MARNTELVRQWEILREIDAARTGIPIAKLAAMRQVHQRTIRRDLDALQRAGFPLIDEKVNNTPMWKLGGRPFQRLEEIGLGFTELCALYFGRTLLAVLSGPPLNDDMERALAKLERALPAASRKFLDRMPLMIKAKAIGARKHDARKSREILGRILDAAFAHRRVQMKYHSASSRRTKDYLVEPLRVSYADGGMYLSAWVPEYNEVRQFALERVRTLGVTDETFEPRPLPAEPFANSIGVFSGSPEPIEIEFDATAAEFVASREWHRSQDVKAREDGSVRMRLCVCNDRPLRTWILGFGAAARVVSPAALAREIAGELDAAWQRYLPKGKREPLKMTLQAGATMARQHVRQPRVR